MYNYTITFVTNDGIAIPDGLKQSQQELPEKVLKKMESHEFDLVDFNLTKNYSQGIASHYIENCHKHRSVLEIIIELNKNDLNSREAIYNKCLKTLSEKKLYLGCAYENEVKEKNIVQSIIKFVDDSQKVECYV